MPKPISRAAVQQRIALWDQESAIAAAQAQRQGIVSHGWSNIPLALLSFDLPSQMVSSVVATKWLHPFGMQSQRTAENCRPSKSFW